MAKRERPRNGAEPTDMAFALRLVEASRRIGHSSDARLRWLLHFAQEIPRNAAHLAGQELEGKNAEVYAFIFEPVRAGSQHHYGRAAVQLSNRDLAYLASQAWNGIQTVTSGSGPFTIKLRNVQRHIFARGDGSYFAAYDAAEPRVTFLMAVADLLTRSGVRLRRCQYGKCGRVFVPRKRQAFCSKLCSLSERARRFRERTPRKQLSDARHQLYVRHYARKHGISEDEAEREVRRRPPKE